MRDCENCARCGRDGCKAWDCDFIPRKEAIKAWKDNADIVRCKECKAYDLEFEWCKALGLNMNPDDFCSYGEREGE